MIEEAATPQDEPTPDLAALDALLRRIERLEEILTMSGLDVPVATAQAETSGTRTPNTSSGPFASDVVPDVSMSTTARRRFLKLAGTAAAGSLVFRPTAAAAADGANLVIGSTTNQASSATSLKRSYSATSTPEPVVTFESLATGSDPVTLLPRSGDGAVGIGLGNSGVGLLGISPGYGVRGESASGYALSAGGNGRLGFDVHTPIGPPPSGELSPGVFATYRAGDMILDGVGSMWACTTGNVSTPSTPAVFRRLSGPATAGQLHLLPSPKRAYDSRPPFPNPGDPAATGGDGPLAAGPSVRTVSVALGWDGTASTTAVEVGATAALINLTITQTVGGGFLAVVAAGATWAGNSTTNWSASNQTVALTTIVGVDAQRRIDVRARGGTGASSQFIVDVIGYFR